MSTLNTLRQQAHEFNLDAAQRELDQRNAEGEDVSALRVDPRSAQIIPAVSIDARPYLYRPIAAFDGRVLKCCGLATHSSRAIVQEHADGGGLPGCHDAGLIDNGVVVEVDHYAGDRIFADTLLEYCGF